MKIKRIGLLIIGTCLISFGIACFSIANIGMSPISSFPFVMSIMCPTLTLGNWVLLWNAFFAILQIPVEGKKYKKYLLLQIPLAFLLGYVTDFAKYILSSIHISYYWQSIIFAFIGILLTAAGIVLTVKADLILNGPEAFIHSLSDRLKIKFGNLKIGFDIFCVIMAVVPSIILLGKVEGIREGTVFSMLFTGIFVNIINKLMGCKSPK